MDSKEPHLERTGQLEVALKWHRRCKSQANPESVKAFCAIAISSLSVDDFSLVLSFSSDLLLGGSLR